MSDDKWLGPAPDDHRNRKEKINSWGWRNKKRIGYWIGIIIAIATVIGLIDNLLNLGWISK